MSKSKRPVVLTIAGSDSSCGAGAQADLKTISAHDCYGLTAITCIVAEVPGKVKSIQPVKPEILRDQLEVLFAAYPIAAVKTGMLYSSALIHVVADALEKAARKQKFALVVDPVMVATSGTPLLRKNAIEDYRQRLFPLADLITPNLDELCILAGVREIRDLEAMKLAGHSLRRRYNCAFLLKGGHLRSKTAVDVLVTRTVEKRYSAAFIQNVHTHGTGCTYSAAIAANLAHKMPLPEAVGSAKKYITRAIRQHLRWGNICALENFPQG
ncbi:MAG: bifunctional hydroxymethylpyrimidine kinase/phosphomethylpyrimidine kinase [Chthoniobacterales bacterium]